MSICTARAAPSFGQELRPRETRPDYQQRVALVHHVGAWPGAEKSDCAGHERQIVGDHRLAQKRLGDARAELVGNCDHLVLGPERARADQDRDPLTGIEDVGGAAQVVVGRHDHWPRVTGAGTREAVGAPWRFVRLLLDVLGEDDHGGRAARHREPHRAVDDMGELRGMADFLDVGCDVGEHPVEVEFLLVARAAHRRFGLPANGEHRHMVEGSVVEPGQEVRCARAAGR